MNKIHKLGRTRSNPFGMPLLAILIFLGTCQSLWAQVKTGYDFVSSSGTYSPITGTLLTPTTPPFDNQDVPVPLPFPFTFNGIPYTTCTLNVNGYLYFGNAIPPTATPIASANVGGGVISAFTKDLVQRSVAPVSELRGDVVGTAPNREVVIQFSNWGSRVPAVALPNITIPAAGSINADIINFQIRLQENGNKVVVSYGTMTITSAATAGVSAAIGTQVGLRGATNTDFNIRAVGNAGNWAASTAGSANTAFAAVGSVTVVAAPAEPAVPATPISAAIPAVAAVAPVPSATSPLLPVFPASGLTYLWTPKVCTGVPTASVTLSSLPIVSLTKSYACPGIPFDLSVSAGDISNAYQWQSGTAVAGPFTNILGANGPTYTATLIGNTAYRCVISCTVTSGVPPTATTTSFTATPILIEINQSVNCYCLPTVVANVGCITNVTIGSINNTTSCATNVNHLGTNTGVTNFPSNITTSLTPGTSPTINVATVAATTTRAVWVDFNRNGIYETTEYFAITGGVGTIVVPALALGVCELGLTRMRVRSRLGAITNADACTSFPVAPSGEIEDYYVTINPTGCTAVVVTPSASMLNLTKDVLISPSIQIAATGGSPAPYTYVLSTGTLPSGVTFNAATGTISGTPDRIENGSFTITVTSSAPGLCKGSMVYNYSIDVACSAIDLASAPAVAANTPFLFTISKSVSIENFTTSTVAGVVTPVVSSFAISAGALPLGLLLNTATGFIIGTPSAVGSGTFSVTSTSIPGNCTKTATYTYTIACPTATILPAAGELIFKWNNEAAGFSIPGGAAYSYSISAGALPTGLIFTATGGFSATGSRPTVLGQTGTFTVSATTATPSACIVASVVYTYKVVCSDIFLYTLVTPSPEIPLNTPFSLAVPPNMIFTKGLPIEPIVLTAIEVGLTDPLDVLVPYVFSVPALTLPAGLTFVVTPATIPPAAPAPATYVISGTPTTVGTGTFTITAENPNAIIVPPTTKCSATSTTNFTVIDNPTTSLDVLANSVKVFPNPSKGEFNVDFSRIALGKATIRIYDIQGKQVYASNVSNNLMTISLENLSSGIYLMEVDSAKGRILKRLAKQ